MNRFILILLAAALVVGGTVSCSEKPGDDGGSAVNPEASADAAGGEAAPEPEPDPYDYAREKFDAVAQADFDGADFVGTFKNVYDVESA